MVRFALGLTVMIVVVTIAVGQNDKFEYECDILKRLEQLEIKLKEAEMPSKKAKSAATYVRWGRTTCPGNGTELVYSGIAGGSYYTHPGAAANHLCLPKIPVYGQYYEDALQDIGDFVHGAEYELDGRVNRMKFFPDLKDRTNLNQNNVPCAVCRTFRPTVLMVPAQNTCMDDWTLEYKGILVSGHYNHAAPSEYICLDDQPEYFAGGGKDENGKLLYFVEGRCTSLPCPPYVNGREITCSVCSK